MLSTTTPAKLAVGLSYNDLDYLGDLKRICILLYKRGSVFQGCWKVEMIMCGKPLVVFGA